MALDTNIRGSVSGNGAEVNAANQLRVIPETDLFANPDNVGAFRMCAEVDTGEYTGTTLLIPPEIDHDYRQRVALDIILDEEVFNYTAQNTGKHSYSNTTMANAWTAGQLTTNSGSITTTTTGTQFQTYASFAQIGTSVLSADAEVAFSAQPNANTFVEWGLGLPGTSTTSPTDGVFFRLNSNGLQGIVSYNGSETSTGVFNATGGTGTWKYTNSKKYQFIVYQSATEAIFWVNEGAGAALLGRIELPTATGRVSMASSGPFFFKHRITGGAAGTVFQANMAAYSVRMGGPTVFTTLSTQGSRTLGSYQGLSGGTMGSLANYANSANPTAAVPTNTTAALGTGLGGQFWETVTLALNTDGIICSYQVPAATANVQGKRLVIRGIGLTSYVQTVVAGGPYVAQYSLAFGHTNVSLATTESATAKAPRRVPLAGLTQVVTAAQAVSTIVSQPGDSFMDFGDAPIFVNPGEFVALVTKHVGTVGTSGTVAHVVTFVYGWE